MKLISSIAFFGLLSFAAGQHGHDEDHSSSSGSRTLGPSPTESVGCVSHGDHWDCEGPRVTAPAVLTTTVSGVAITTTSTHSHSHSHHDDDDDDHKTDKPGTGSLKPSPTESFGCTAHGDHWHCEGRVGATATGTSRSSSTATGTAGGSTSPTSGASRAQVVGLGLVVAAVGLAL